jgi:hypothetical protein
VREAAAEAKMQGQGLGSSQGLSQSQPKRRLRESSQGDYGDGPIELEGRESTVGSSMHHDNRLATHPVAIAATWKNSYLLAEAVEKHHTLHVLHCLPASARPGPD